MTLDTGFSLFGINFEIDPLTGIEVSNGIVGVEANPDGSTEVTLLNSEVVGVDLTQGVTVDLANSEVVDVDLTETAASVEVADEVVDVDSTQGIASVEVAGVPVELDLTQAVMYGVGEEILFADISEGVAIAEDSLAEFGIEIPVNLDS